MPSKPKKFVASVFATVGCLGAMTAIAYAAVNIYSNVETETGTRAGAVSVLSDASASGGSAVMFGSAADSEFPTPQTTGPRTTTLAPSGPVTSSSEGQIIQNLEVTGQVNIRHDNVIVRDVRIYGIGTYMITTSTKSDGQCPVNVRFEYIEIDGTQAAENDIPIFSNCGNMVVDHAYVHEVGRSSRLTNNMTISNSYIFSSRTGDSGAHRGGVGINGGSDNVIYNNVLKCEGTGCSAAIPNYGDFSPVVNLRIEHNLLATTGGFCAYGGSLPAKPYPEGSNIDFINNHFSTEYWPDCGRYGTVSGFANGERGNEWYGNVWHETGEAVNL